MSHMLHIVVALLVVPCSLALAQENSPGSPGAAGVRITPLADRVRVDVNGRLLTEYFFTNVPRPYCYPLIGPGNLAMTRSWPMASPPGEAHDHPHHRSFWFAHGKVNGQDFWSEEKSFGKIVHQGFDETSSGTNVGVIKARNHWVAADGKIVCSDERTLKFYTPVRAGEQVLDFEITLKASQGELTLGDTKEGTFALRVAESMRLKGGQGHILNSEGARDDKTWGKRANWCDYSGPVNGQAAGIAIFDHPGNPRHPTWWHVRDYGLFAANPFGRHDFEKLKDTTAGDLRVPAGDSVTFRYRVLLHLGELTAAQLDERYRECAGR